MDRSPDTVVHLTTLQILSLVAAALAAGTVDAIAGGGGLITLPALLAVGIPPHLALGTNKGQSVFGSAASLASFWHAGAVDGRVARVAFPFGLAGSAVGASLVMLVPPHVLRPLVIALLITAAVILTLRRSPKTVVDRAAIHGALVRAAVIAFVIGAYDGFFGPGTGTFLIAAYVVFLGATMTEATGDAKVVNFASNLAAVIAFGAKGLVLWNVALPMAGAQLVGGVVGARLAVKGGDRLIRAVVLAVVAALVAKIAWDMLHGRR